MAEIVLQNVSKSYADGAGSFRDAVRDFSISIADGEFIILVGPSGCGKSTTLNMIAGLEDITSGELRIDSVRVNDKAPKDRDIAMVFQSYALYPHMTVRQNIAFPLTLTSLSKAEIAEKVDDTATILDLTDFLDRRPAQLSGGQRQRVAMGRAIIRDPKAFLMDEPLSNLDAKLRVQMRGEIARLQQRLGTTTIYVTHDQTEAMTLGDRVVVMRGGVAQQIGTPEELYERPANLFVAGFIGSPAMNFFSATFTDVGIKLPFGEITLTQDAHDVLTKHRRVKNLIAGIRPEHLEDAALLDGYARIRSLTFPVTVDMVESLGPDKYLYFTNSESGARAEQLAELAADSGTGENEFVARVSTESQASKGRGVELAFDTSKVLLFDADTGINLSVPPPGGAVSQVLTEVRAHLVGHFTRLFGTGMDAEPDSASVTFLGVERIEVLRFGPDRNGFVHYVSLGCSRHPMGDPTQLAADPLHGPRAEVVVSLRDSAPTPGVGRAVAVLAATPAVDGVVLQPDALIDLGATLWDGARVSAVVLGVSDIPDLTLDSPREPVRFLSAIPISANEAAWVRLKGIDELRRTWEQDGVDVRDPGRL